MLWLHRIQCDKICFCFKMRRMIINLPPRVDIRLTHPWLQTRLFSRGFGKWFRIFVRTEIELQAPPADKGVDVPWVMEWNFAADCMIGWIGDVKTLKLCYKLNYTASLDLYSQFTIAKSYRIVEKSLDTMFIAILETKSSNSWNKTQFLVVFPFEVMSISFLTQVVTCISTC